MKIISIILLMLYINCSSTTSKKNVLNKQGVLQSGENNFTFLYKRPLDTLEDEYKEGVYYVYDIQRSVSYMLPDTVIIGASEGWIISDNKVVILNISDIAVFDENQKKIDQIFFEEGEIVLGGGYNKGEGIIYFLLKNTKRNQIDLCKVTLETSELKRIMQNIDIIDDEPESPFRKFFFTEDDRLFIEDYCYSFSVVNLKDSSITKINLDEGDCYGCSLGRNRKGIIYVKYTDASRTSYELKEYNFSTQKSQLLLDGKNKYLKTVSVELFTDSGSLPFLIKIDGKLFSYDYSTFNEIKINASEILSYSQNYLIYLDSLGKVRSHSF